MRRLDDVLHRQTSPQLAPMMTWRRNEGLLCWVEFGEVAGDAESLVVVVEEFVENGGGHARLDEKRTGTAAGTSRHADSLDDVGR